MRTSQGVGNFLQQYPAMPDFDAEGFVAAVEQLGLLLTAVRFPDGNVRLARISTRHFSRQRHRPS
jgi:hypothetical protein